MSVEWISAQSGMISEDPSWHPGPPPPSTPSGNTFAIRSVVLEPVLDQGVARVVAFAS